MLEGLESIARKARRKSDCDAILQQAVMVISTYRQSEHLETDFRGLQTQFERVQAIVDQRIKRATDHADSLEEQRGSRREDTETDTSQSSVNPPAEGEING
jgi:hypothetical protein